MNSDSREEQRNELEALCSIYEENRVQYEEADCISGRISIELEPLSSPVAVFSNSEKGRYSVNLTALPQVKLLFRFPPDYPNVRPVLELECEWMNDNFISTLESKLNAVCDENVGMGVLYFCCETIVEEVKSMLAEVKEICLDDTPFGRKNNLSASELVKRVTESSALSEDRHFESGCFDCEICFENKVGLHCVQFKPCMHVFCKECVAAFFTERLNSLEVRELTCPASECTSVASERIIRNAIGDDEFERYDRILLARTLGQMSDVVTCPRKTCQNPVLVSERTRNLGSCTVCGLSFCVLCFRTYHGVDECKFKTYDKQRMIEEWNTSDQKGRVEMARRFGGLKNLENLIHIMMSEGWMDGNSKPCPRCRVRIEKDEGCNKMHCTKCDAMFCWLCERVLDKNNPYDHFNENAGTCANRLFEGIAHSDSDDDEFVVQENWADLVQNDSDSDDDDYDYGEGDAHDDDDDDDDDDDVIFENAGNANPH